MIEEVTTNYSEYTISELREMIANLRLVKETSNKYELRDKSEIELTTYELLLEFKKKEWEKEMDEFLNKLGEKNGYTEY